MLKDELLLFLMLAHCCSLLTSPKISSWSRQLHMMKPLILGGERWITIREGACHGGVQAAALLRNGVWLQGRGRSQRQEEEAGRRGLQAAGLFLAHTVSFDWKSETEDRAYCFGSEWLEILLLDVPRALGPFQDRRSLGLTF
uniref:Uncharacterized protein n=1 Tax=Triticum urartu TaxID=4572 RepID=A0A8R7V4W7_TRIUA